MGNKLFHENPLFTLKWMSRYAAYTRSARWSKSKLHAFQDNKLRKIIQYAGKHVPYYRELFSQIGLDTKSFRGRDDLHKIPLLDKETLRTRPEEFISDEAGKLNCRTEKTSGSTGTPLEILLDEESRINKMAASWRAHVWAGDSFFVNKFMIKGLSGTYKQDYGVVRDSFFRKCVFLNSSRMTKETCLAAAELLRRYQPVFYEGYSRSFIDFLQFIKDKKHSIISPRGIFCYGETLSQQTRSFVENGFTAKVYDFYANAENSAMICQLPSGRKLFTEDYFYPEVLDGNGYPSETNYGELVSTSFYNYAMPLIRYRTRDNVRLADKQDCSFREVLEIEGRMDDYLLLPNGRKIYFADGALGYAKGIIAAQYIQYDIDEITINLVVDSHFLPEYYNDIESNLRRIKNISEDVDIKFAIVDKLEKSKSGKAPLIISKLKK